MFQTIKKSFYKIHLNQNKSPISTFSTKANGSGNHTHVLTTSETYGIITGQRNGITVVDLDTNKWTEYKEHIFIKQFGEDFVEKFDTFTSKTVRGGYHLYFKYEPLLLQTQTSPCDIDIRNDGGYAIGPGSFVQAIDSQTKEKYSGSYTVERDVEIKQIPDELLNWLLENIYKKTKEQVRKHKEKIDQIKLHEQSVYRYDINRDDIVMICDKLVKFHPEYLETFNGWFKFTTFCKILNVQDIWTEYSKKSAKYDENNNIKTWNTCDVDVAIVEHILTVCGMSERIVYYKYKPIIENKIEPQKTFNSKKLGYDFFKKGINFVEKSDTGTGKTTSFKHYIKNTDQKFISIVSRESLGHAQYSTFCDENIECDFYKTVDSHNSNSIIVCLDSIMSISYWKNYKNCVLFLDEFSSILEHLFESPTLGNKRIIIFLEFIKMIRECKQIIAVDADINDSCIQFLDFCGINYQYEVNTYKHASGVVATEWTDQVKLIQHIKTLDKYLIACDSLAQAKYLFEQLGDKEIQLYTKESKTHIDFDKFNKIIFSPKVVYGIDSTMRRPVFCFYWSHTISPKHMVQQINRCRDIEYLGYIFLNKDPTFKAGKMIKVGENKEAYFGSLNTTKKYSEDVINYDIKVLELVKDQSVIDIYYNILNNLIYQNDCYGTNKMLHFKRLIRERGLVDKNIFSRNATVEKIDTKRMKVEAIVNFDIKTEANQRINNILQLPEDSAQAFAEWFVDGEKLKKHFNICNYFFKGIESIEKEIKEVNDFKYNVVLSDKNKVLFFQKMIDLYSGSIDSDTKQIILNEANTQNVKKMETEYKLLFRYRGKKELDFSNKDNGMAAINTISNQLFGKKIIYNKRINNKGIFTREYFINQETLNLENLLYDYRHQDIKTVNTGNMFEAEEDL